MCQLCLKQKEHSSDEKNTSQVCKREGGRQRGGGERKKSWAAMVCLSAAMPSAEFLVLEALEIPLS